MVCFSEGLFIGKLESRSFPSAGFFRLYERRLRLSAPEEFSVNFASGLSTQGT